MVQDYVRESYLPAADSTAVRVGGAGAQRGG
jgi:hypothetical protein